MILCASPGEQYQAHRKEIDAAIARVCESGYYVLGKEVAAFEKEFAAYCGTEHALGVGSGTEALHLALTAMDIGPGDEVITVSHTAVATVSAVELAGAHPVLVDIDPRTFTISAAEVEKAITPQTRAIIAVHLYGQPADLDTLLSLAKKHGLRLIEDCAQSTGARYRGQPLGSFGDFGCFSFYPTKNLGAIGDGGALVTRNPEFAKKALLLRQYGWEERYISKIGGWNSRLDELQAAILRVKLRYLDTDNAQRVKLADLYDEGLKGTSVAIPERKPGHVYHLYVIRSKQRDRLQNFLKSKDIHTMVHYPMPIHLQPAYQGRIRADGGLPETCAAADEVLSLPMYPELSAEAVQQVIRAIREFH